MLCGKNGRRLIEQGRQIVHVIVDGLQFAAIRILEHFIETAFLRFARKKGNPHLLAFDHFGRHLRKHGKAA